MAAPAKKCPECKSQVPLEARHCPNCPHSFPETADEAASMIDTGQSWSPLPLIFMLGLAAVFGGLWKVFFQFGTNPDSIMSEKSLIETKAEKTAKAQKKQLTEAPEGHWLFQGMVRDLITLDPVPAAKLSFRAGGAVIEASPDELGLYSAVLPAGSGPYRVTVSAKGYSPSYVNPNIEGVGGFEPQKREEMAADLASGEIPPYEVQGHDRTPVAVDFFLARRK